MSVESGVRPQSESDGAAGQILRRRIRQHRPWWSDEWVCGTASLATRVTD